VPPQAKKRPREIADGGVVDDTPDDDEKKPKIEVVDLTLDSDDE